MINLEIVTLFTGPKWRTYFVLNFDFFLRCCHFLWRCCHFLINLEMVTVFTGPKWKTYLVWNFSTDPGSSKITFFLVDASVLHFEHLYPILYVNLFRLFGTGENKLHKGFFLEKSVSTDPVFSKITFFLVDAWGLHFEHLDPILDIN